MRSSVQNRDTGQQVITTRTAEIWLGDDGVVHVKPVPRTQQDLPDAVENMAAIVRVGAGMPRPLVIHWQQASLLTPACRSHYMAPEALQNVTAVAVVTSSMLGRILGNLMMGMSNRVCVRLFDDERAATTWLNGTPASKKGARS